MQGTCQYFIDKIFKFTVVRNPFDRIVSSFFFLKQNGYINKDFTFRYFVLNELPKYDLTENTLEENQNKRIIQRHCSFQYIRCGHEYIDFIAKFDNIKEDWKYIASKIDANPILPHYRKSEHDDYKNYYDKELINIVSEIYSKDIKTFKFNKLDYNK